ncbi:hypothetical protein [Burkholderia alba]|uniref:hypothetical protein n=1 Tax=Burkholderia alba TaxID=2683677 RepID=UPI002B051BA9|nr:hypothetical protein [Burkholderia alba]
MRQAAGAAVLLMGLAGCVSVYGPGGASPGQRGAAPPQAESGAGGGAAGRLVIGNRQYDEVWRQVGQFYADRRLAARVTDRPTGLVAAAYDDAPNAGNFLDCPDLAQTSNVTRTLKVIARLDDAAQGVAVSIDVTGTAGVSAGGKNKVARVACRSNGTLERALSEALRK